MLRKQEVRFAISTEEIQKYPYGSSGSSLKISQKIREWGKSYTNEM